MQFCSTQSSLYGKNGASVTGISSSSNVLTLYTWNFAWLRSATSVVDCSGLGGAPIFDSIQGDLFLKCMPSAPVYGPSLAHLDVYADDRKHRRTTSIGRTAQIHDFHMLHVAAWPKGVNAWERILGLMNLPVILEAKPSKILTPAGVLAATGKKLPAHLRDAHPGFELGLRLILDCLLPVPLRTYLTEVLSPAISEETGWLMASAAPHIRDATRELRERRVIFGNGHLGHFARPEVWTLFWVHSCHCCSHA